MLPILISETAPISTILSILLVKFSFGMIYGFIIDLTLRHRKKEEEKIIELCEEEHCHCEESLIKSALKHTLNITIYIFILTLLVNILVSFIGEKTLSDFMSSSKVFRTNNCIINRIDTKLCFISNYNRIIFIKDNKFWVTNRWIACKCRNTVCLFYLRLIKILEKI